VAAESLLIGLMTLVPDWAKVTLIVPMAIIVEKRTFLMLVVLVEETVKYPAECTSSLV
jgi:hypothetical protein